MVLALVEGPLWAAFLLEDLVLVHKPLLGLFVILSWLSLAISLRAETCRASFYGYESSHVTASGERFQPEDLTAAHRKLRFGAQILVAALGRSVIVRINDRGPAAWTGRCLDLSEGAALVLGMMRAGVLMVRITQLN